MGASWRRRGFIRVGRGARSGAREALLTQLCFVIVGAGAVELGRALDALQGPANWERALYPGEMAPNKRAPSQWLVDGFNVVSVALLRERRPGAGGEDGGRDLQGWWRREHRDALVERAQAFDDPEAEVWIVFDGPDASGNRLGAPARTVFATSADDWLLDRVREAEEPDRLAVVTADRRLANRVRARGACVVSPGDFLLRCGSGSVSGS